MKHPYIPQGCDQQGRIEPAEAATEVGHQDAGTQVGLGVALCALSALVVILCILAGFLYAGGLNRLFTWMLSCPSCANSTPFIVPTG